MSAGPHRIEIETLLASLRPGEPYPGWARLPASEAEFAASLIAHARDLGRTVTPVYDDSGHLIEYRGIRLKAAA
jgi:hypothetical protein